MAYEEFKLSGKVVVITGGGSGIGRSCAFAFGRAGSRVAVLDNNLPNAEETGAAINGSGGEALAFSCDVSNEASVQEVATKVASRLGACDVLVNNAGMIRAGALDELSVTDWNHLLSVNLTGYFLCAKTFGRQMREKGRGAIVNMSSVASEHATPFAGAYSVAKAGCRMLSRQIAVEWGPHGIRSNCVSPGLILTALSEAMYERPGIREAREAMVPSRRIGTPEDVAKAVLFLASDLSDYINGDEITVDGGIVRNLLKLVPRAGYE